MEPGLDAVPTVRDGYVEMKAQGGSTSADKVGRDGYAKVDLELGSDDENYDYADADRKIDWGLGNAKGKTEEDEYVGRSASGDGGGGGVSGDDLELGEEDEEYDDVDVPTTSSPAVKDGGYVEFLSKKDEKKKAKEEKKRLKEEKKKEKKKKKDKDKEAGYIQFTFDGKKEPTMPTQPLPSIELTEEDEEGAEEAEPASPAEEKSTSGGRVKAIGSAFKSLKANIVKASGSLRRERSPSRGGGGGGGGSESSSPTAGRKANKHALMEEVKSGASMCGYLSVKKTGVAVGGKWDKRYYVLKERALYSAKRENETTVRVDVAVLLGYAVKLLAKGDGLLFDVSHPNMPQLSFKGDDSNDVSTWIKNLELAAQVDGAKDNGDDGDSDDGTLYENPSDDDETMKMGMGRTITARSLPPEPIDEELYEDVDEEEEQDEEPVPKPKLLNVPTPKAAPVAKAPAPAAVPLPPRAPRQPPPPEKEDDDGEVYDDIEDPGDVKTATAKVAAPQTSPSGDVYKIIRPHLRRDAKELTVKRGDLIRIDDKSDDMWWTGTLQSRDGTFTGERGFVMKTYIKEHQQAK